MIYFEVTDGPDLNVISPFKFFQNQIHIGKSSGDLWINDGQLSVAHIMLEVIGKDLLIHPHKNVDFYLLNGKRATAIRKLKIDDQVLIGQTKIKILGFEETVRESKKEILNQKLNQLIEENSSRLDVIESLTQQMK